MKHMVACLAVAFALYAGAAEYSQIEVDASSLPKERAFLREVVLSRIWARTPPTSQTSLSAVALAKADQMSQTLTVRFVIDPTLPDENAKVTVANGDHLFLQSFYHNRFFQEEADHPSQSPDFS